MACSIHRFSVWVNCFLPKDDTIVDRLNDREELYEDYGVILLPDNYSETGKPSRLVIRCHGAGGTVSKDDSQIEHSDMTKYLAANGYAVMDVCGLPHLYAHENGIDIRNNVGSPIAIRCYVKAYHYCMEKYNLLPEVFIHGGSMGGISSTNLVLSGLIPVIAHSAFCPVLDTYNQIFLRPWSGGLPKTALGKIYGFDTDENGEYIYDEKKLTGYNPVNNKKAEVYPVPVKFWHCVDDDTVAYEVTKRFISRLKANGVMAYLHTFSYGRHEPQLVGQPVEKPCGIDVFNGQKLRITPAEEEAFIWIRNFS